MIGTSTEITLGELYLNMLTALGCSVDETGSISLYGKDVKSDENSDLTFLLPIKNNIKDVDILDKGTGKFIKNKQLFNPLDENSLNNTTPSLNMMKNVVMKRINYLIVGCMGLLLELGSNNLANISALNVGLNKYIESINGLIKPNMISVIDDKTVSMFKALTDAVINIDGGFMKIFIKNNGLIGDTKYYKVTTIYSDIYREFFSAENDKTQIATLNTLLRDKYGVKLNLRQKDVSVFLVIMKTIIPNIKHDGNVYYGSVDQETPSVCSLWSGFYNIVTSTNSIAAGLSTSFPALANELIVDLSDVPDSLDGLSIRHRDELQHIPRDSRRAIKKIGETETIEKIDHVRISPKIPGLGERLGSDSRNIVATRDTGSIARPNREIRHIDERPRSTSVPETIDKDPLSRLIDRESGVNTNVPRYIEKRSDPVRRDERDRGYGTPLREFDDPRNRGRSTSFNNRPYGGWDDSYRYNARGRDVDNRYGRRYDRVLGDDLLY